MYEATRRVGLVGRIGILRGLVRDAGTGTSVMRTRSARMAETVASALNGERLTQTPGHVDQPSLASRYSASVKPDKDGRTFIYGTEANWRQRASFGDGIIGVTQDATLARRVVEVLSKIDPAPRAPTWRGWF
jgi:hypothetical protein